MSKIFKPANDKHTDRESYEFLAKEFTGTKDLSSLLGVLKRSKETTKSTISWSGAAALDNDIMHLEKLLEPVKA